MVIVSSIIHLYFYTISLTETKSDDDNAFTSNGTGVEGITSSQIIKGFPFTPKSFYIDVISTETEPGWWEHKIKNWKQLNRVWKYYKKPVNL